MFLQKKVAMMMIKVSSRRPGARTKARSLHSWTPMMTMLFLTEEEEEEDDDNDAHPSSEKTSMRLWGGAGEEEDNNNNNNNTNRAEGIARSRAGFSATGSPRTPHPKRL